MSFDEKSEELESTDIDWKSLYLQETQNYMKLEQKYRCLYQDIKYHIEYNQLLENKISSLENEYFRLLETHHKKIVENKLGNLKASLDYVDNLRKTLPEINIDNLKDKVILNSMNHEIICEKNINEDLKRQLNNSQKEKEDLQRELLLTKSQLLEFSEKLDEELEKNLLYKESLQQKVVPK